MNFDFADEGMRNPVPLLHLRCGKLLRFESDLFPLI